MAPLPLTERFFICGNCNIKPRRFDQFISEIGTLSEYHAARGESGPLTFYFAVPAEYSSDIASSDNVLAFESYASRDDFEKALKSPALAYFMENGMPAMSTDFDVQHFSCVGGFLDSSGDKANGEIVNTIQIRCHGTGQRAAFLGTLESLVSELETRDDKGGMLTFVGLKSLDDHVSARIIARYTTRWAWETWKLENELTVFWERVRPFIASKQSRVYVPAGKGWVCR